MTTPLELLRTIAVALERGHLPSEILDENSPLRDELRRLVTPAPAAADPGVNWKAEYEGAQEVLTAIRTAMSRSGNWPIGTSLVDAIQALATPAPVAADTLRLRLQKQCSGWGAYWRASDSHGVELTKPQAIELLEDALGVEVEIKDNGCAPCDGTGMIGGERCPDCASPARAIPAQGAAPVPAEPLFFDEKEPLWIAAARERISQQQRFSVGSDLHLLEQALIGYESARKWFTGTSQSGEVAGEQEKATEGAAELLAFLCNVGKDRFIQEEKGMWRVYQDEAAPAEPAHFWQAMTTRWFPTPAEAILAARDAIAPPKGYA